jgi:DivIVA domain-containing protein
MSVVEQGAASKKDVEIGVPEFPVAIRGYDRTQVDAFLHDLSVRVTAERRRAEQAERTVAQLQAELAGMHHQAPLSFEHLGAEAGRVLEQAGSSAKLLVEEARSRGRAMVEEAEEQARGLIDRAERRAAEIEAEAQDTLAAASDERQRILSEAARSIEEARSQAEREVRAALADAQAAADDTRHRALAEQTAMRAETDRLGESRERMLEYLGRIHTDLGELLAEAVQADAEVPAAPNGQVAMEAFEDDDEGPSGAAAAE